MSVLDQEGVSLELIVVDDASTDDTLETIESFKDPRISIAIHETNLGANAARNAGIRIAKGRYVAFLDSDDEWLPGKLEKQVSILQTRPEVGLVYCGHFGGYGGVASSIEPHIDYRTGRVYEDLLAGWCPHGNSLTIVRRELLFRVGLYDTDLLGFQDYDLWLRLARLAEFEAVPEPLVVKHQHSGHQLTTDPISRHEALKTFMGKWQGEIEIAHGQETVRAVNGYHRQRIRRAAVIQALRNGSRSEAWGHYWSLLRLCAEVQLSMEEIRRCASLLPGLVFGHRAYELARSLTKSFKSSLRRSRRKVSSERAIRARGANKANTIGLALEHSRRNASSVEDSSDEWVQDK